MFTKRKWQIFYLIEKGLASPAIGRELGISQHTVDVHVAQMRKLVKAKNRAELISIVKESGWCFGKV